MRQCDTCLKDIIECPECGGHSCGCGNGCTCESDLEDDDIDEEGEEDDDAVAPPEAPDL